MKTKSFRFSLFMFIGINLLLVTIAAFIVLTGSYLAKTERYCLTEKCVNTAYRVISALDRTADPCNDFYQFACGGWIKKNPLPEWTSSWNQLAMVKESLAQDMRQLLESGEEIQREKNYTEPIAVGKARSFYRTCMNDTEIGDGAYVDHLRRVMESIGLPADPYNTTTLDWLYIIANIKRSLGFDILVSFAVSVDVRNSSLNKMTIRQTAPGFSEKYLLNTRQFEQEIEHYKAFITRTVGTYMNKTIDESFAEDVVDLSTQLAKAMTPTEIRTSGKHKFHEVTLHQLARGQDINSTTWRTLNWTRYMDLLFEYTNVTLDHMNDTVLVLDEPYLKKLSVILKDVNATKLGRFLWWSTLSKLPVLTPRFQEATFEFFEKLYGIQQKPPKWKVCTYAVNNHFGFAVSYLYIRNNFDDKHKARALEMLEDIKHAFEVSVQGLNWMDVITREKTLIKLHAMRAFVGYPGWVMNTTQLDYHYKDLNVTVGDMLATYLNLWKVRARVHLENTRRNANRNKWMPPSTVNAFYSSALNSVIFPAGILQTPFFDNGIHAIDYGAIGSIMGHEITHGFDDQGRRYDENGNLKQWWSPATLEHYQERVQCIINQYNNYWMPELGPSFKVHGINTRGENIADNGGLRTAFEGYKYRKGKSGMDINQSLPGLSNVTTDQLFFLGYAQNWCGNSTLGALKSSLVGGVHSPNRIRVLGTLANSAEFAEAWNCPAGSPMNPINKCVLW